MDWKVFLTAFAMTFVAELGDKTQIGVFSLVASGKSPWLVFVAASLALVTVTLIGALAGKWISTWLPTQVVHISSGILFIVIGIWILVKNS